MQYIERFIVAILIVTVSCAIYAGIKEKPPIISLLMDQQYGQDLRVKFGSIFHNLKKGQQLLVYDANHHLLADILMKSDYPRMLREKAYVRELNSLDKFFKKPVKSFNSITEHLEFLSRKRMEIKTDKYNAIIFMPPHIPLIDKVLEKIKELPIESFITTPGSPFFVDDTKPLKNLVVHMQYPLTINKHFYSKYYCQLLVIYIQSSGGKVASCQSESVMGRVFDEKFYWNNIEISNVKKNPQFLDYDWDKGIVKKNEEKSPDTTQPVVVNQIFVGGGEKKIIPSTANIRLEWTGLSDMDLSIYSQEGNLNFSAKSLFGIWSKGEYWENIKLSRIPANSFLRVVLSKGSVPSRINLIISSDNSNRNEPLDGIFKDRKKQAQYGDRELVFQRDLEYYLAERSVISTSSKKPPY